jgi:hypothetical protein
MSEAENPTRSGAPQVSVEDVRELCGASTPHFALQLRNRIARLIAGLPAGHPARLLGEQEMARLASLGFDGEQRGHRAEPGLSPLASVNDPTAR